MDVKTLAQLFNLGVLSLWRLVLQVRPTLVLWQRSAEQMQCAKTSGEDRTHGQALTTQR